MELKYRLASLNELVEIQELFVETIKSTCKNEYDNHHFLRQEIANEIFNKLKEIRKVKGF